MAQWICLHRDIYASLTPHFLSLLSIHFARLRHNTDTVCPRLCLTQSCPSSRQHSALAAGPWCELVPPVYPEGDYTPVFCHKCGDKNRQDNGWRSRDDPVERAKYDTAIRRTGLTYGQQREVFDGRPPSWPRLTYEYGVCRDARPATEEDESSEEEEKDGAVQSSSEQHVENELQSEDDAGGESGSETKRRKTNAAVAVAVQHEGSDSTAPAANATAEQAHADEDEQRKRKRPTSPAHSPAAGAQRSAVRGDSSAAGEL